MPAARSSASSTAISTRGLGHRVALEHGQQAGDVGRGQRRPGQEHRGEEVLDHVLGAVDVLGRVPRLAHRHALAPALAGVGLGPHEQDVAVASRRRSWSGTAAPAASPPGAARVRAASPCRAHAAVARCRRSATACSRPSGSRNSALPATSTSAPAPRAPAIVSGPMPPSTSTWTRSASPASVDHPTDLGDLGLHRRQVVLAPEARVDGHDEHEVDEVEDVGDGAGRRRRVERDAGAGAELVDRCRASGGGGCRPRRGRSGAGSRPRRSAAPGRRA